MNKVTNQKTISSSIISLRVRRLKPIPLSALSQFCLKVVPLGHLLIFTAKTRRERAAARKRYWHCVRERAKNFKYNKQYRTSQV